LEKNQTELSGEIKIGKLSGIGGKLKKFEEMMIWCRKEKERKEKEETTKHLKMWCQLKNELPKDDKIDRTWLEAQSQH